MAVKNLDITKKTKLSEILSVNPRAAEMLFNSGLGCIGCPMAMEETIEQGCLAHGMNAKEINDLINKLNESSAEKRRKK